MSSQRRQPTGSKVTYPLNDKNLKVINPTYGILTGNQPVNQPVQSLLTPSTWAAPRSQYASKEQIKQATPGSNPQRSQTRPSSKIAPTPQSLQDRGATMVINNPIAKGGRKKKPVSKPKKKKMTSSKKPTRK